jgi:hypothetical protein
LDLFLAELSGHRQTSSVLKYTESLHQPKALVAMKILMKGERPVIDGE